MTASLCTIATIRKSYSTELMVSISSWRGANRVELLPELIQALHKAEAEAVARRLLKVDAPWGASP